MKIQEVMMKKLRCVIWEQVIEDCPLTSSYKALYEYFIAAFKDWVNISLFINFFFICRGCALIRDVLLPLFEPCRGNKPGELKDIHDFPTSFLAHLERARKEKDWRLLKAYETEFQEI